MAREARAGELRTRVYVFVKAGSGLNENGYPAEETVNVFGDGAFRYCKWVNVHGGEVYAARQAGVEEGATLTLRYSPKITPTCEVQKGDDPRWYEIISVNDVEDRHVWLEVKVQRKGAAK